MIRNTFFFVRFVPVFSLMLAGVVFGGSFKEDYSKAVDAYMSAKSPKDVRRAAEQFEKLQSRNDAGNLASNAIYWHAECNYDLGNYIQALQGFERVLLYPRSNKIEAARFKIGVCYARLGRKKAARWELNRFASDYPQSNVLGRVNSELANLGEKG